VPIASYASRSEVGDVFVVARLGWWSAVRDATREELNRASDLLSQRMRRTIDQGRSIVTDYWDVLLRWLRIAAVIAAILVIVWFVIEFVAQATLLEWLGERIDKLTDG
jgi:hypothetical protein